MKKFGLLFSLALGVLLLSADLKPAQAQYGYGVGPAYRGPNCRVPSPYVAGYRSGYGYGYGLNRSSLYVRPGLTVTSGYSTRYVPRYGYAPVTPLPTYRAGYGYGYGRGYPLPYNRVTSPGVQLRIGF